MTLTTAVEKTDKTVSAAVKEAQASVSAEFESVVASLEDSRAEDIVSIDIRGKSALGDYMVIASGRSNRHVAAIADHLLNQLREQGKKSVQVEGLAGADWVLVDTGDIIIHLFRPEVREFYNLEKMWLTTNLSERPETG